MMNALHRFGWIGQQVGPFYLASCWAGCTSSLLGRSGPILISPNVPILAEPAAPIARLCGPWMNLLHRVAPIHGGEELERAAS